MTILLCQVLFWHFILCFILTFELDGVLHNIYMYTLLSTCEAVFVYQHYGCKKPQRLARPSIRRQNENLINKAFSVVCFAFCIKIWRVWIGKWYVTHFISVKRPHHPHHPTPPIVKRSGLYISELLRRASISKHCMAHYRIWKSNSGWVLPKALWSLAPSVGE